MKKNILVVLLMLGWAAGLSAQQYKVVAVGFYNVENLFDTVPSYDLLFTDRYLAGEYPYMETIPKGKDRVRDEQYWGEKELSDWLDSRDPNVPDTIYLDKRDEDFTATGSLKNNSKVYHQKLENLARVLSELGTAVTPDGAALIGVAEIEQRSVLEDLVRQPAIAGRNYQIIQHNSMDFRGIDVALIYQPKYFKPLHYKALPVEIYYEKDTRGFTRDILWVEGLLNGEKVHVLVNHWPSRSGGEQVSAPRRAAAAQVCKNLIDSLRQVDPEVKIIVMGDFNDDPISPSIAKILQASGKRDALARNELYNPYTEKHKKGNGTGAWRDAWSLFDQIILSQGWLDDQGDGFFFYKAEIYNKPYLISKTGQYRGYPFRSFISGRFSGGYSDHFPVVVYLVQRMAP